MSNDKTLLQNYVLETPRSVTVANKEKLHSEGHGTVELLLKGHSETTKISDVVYVPGLSTNLISVGKIVDKGLEVHFKKQKCDIYCGKDVIASATKVNGVYELDMTSQPSHGYELAAACHSEDLGEPVLKVLSRDQEAANLCEMKSSQELWHRRLSHLNRRSMDLLKKVPDVSERARHPASDNIPYCAAQNGVAERANRTVMQAGRCMLQDAGMDPRFWAEALNTASSASVTVPDR
ncbi:uncharacterized protein LOC133515631 [Cydia pomonella]|uniref:uncharacterized protein LOC133515631 n=1 Tax=Cydia pomonella TaxID=82600 RepID=UPI002ADE7828|nr:uncharacterized protein LOC133515631 [Cydia pomonella]